MSRASVVKHDIQAAGLRHPARVTHPTFNDRENLTWDVLIERISDRAEQAIDGPAQSDTTFRGFARNGAWSGNKTFFASKTTRVVDQLTGEVVEGPIAVEGWLARIARRASNQAAS